MFTDAGDVCVCVDYDTAVLENKIKLKVISS